VISSKGKGIYNESTGSILLGEKNGQTEKERLIIEGKEVALYNGTGNIYWYGGTLKYTDQALCGSITEIEKSTEIKEVNGECYLEKVESVEWLQNQKTGKRYIELQQAIEEGKEKETIKVLQNNQQSTKTMIPENKDIILDLNGHTISTYGTIEVIGNLELIDITNEGKIESHTLSKLIENKGTGNIKISRRHD